MNVDAGGTETSGILVDDGFALRTNLEGFYLKMREPQAGLDRDAARAGADIPQHMAMGEIEGLKGQQADGHFGNHLLSTVKEGEGGVGDAEGPCVLCGFPAENHAVRHGKFALSSLLEGERADRLLLGVAQVLADMHGVVLVAILHHPLCDGGRCMLLVREDANLLCPLYEGTVELRPGPSRQGYDAHVVIGHHKPMSEKLQGVEGGIDLYLGLGHLPLDGIGKTEEERVATGEDYDGHQWIIDN